MSVLVNENLAPRVVIVTGAGGGIGLAVCKKFLLNGDIVVGLDVLAAAIPENDLFISLVCDLTDEDQLALCLSKIRELYGKIDIVVHAAGIVGRGPIQNVSLESWRKVLDANLTSAFLISRDTRQDLIGSKGQLIFFSSTNGRNGGSVLSGPAYAVAKAGVLNLSRYLAKELGPYGVRVNCLAPGPVDTPMLSRLNESEREQIISMSPIGAIADAGHVADMVHYLCSASAAAITGAVINISGGTVLD